jgi:hypothetical protein
MRLNELLFVFLFLGTLIELVLALIAAANWRTTVAKRRGLALGMGWGVYLAFVFGVAAATPQRIIAMNQDRCFDEMCFTVVHVEVVSQLGAENNPEKATGKFYVVTVQVTSRSRGRNQSEKGLRALLWDSGHYFSPSDRGQRAWDAFHGTAASLTARLSPGESVVSVQVFDVPRDLTAPGLVLTPGSRQGSSSSTNAPFHKPTIMQLPS